MIKRRFQLAAEVCVHDAPYQALQGNSAMLVPLVVLFDKHPVRRAPRAILKELSEHKIVLLGELLTRTREDLGKIEGIRKNKVEYLEEVLLEYGYVIGQGLPFVASSARENGELYPVSGVAAIRACYKIANTAKVPSTIPLKYLIAKVKLSSALIESFELNDIVTCFQEVYQYGFDRAMLADQDLGSVVRDDLFPSITLEISRGIREIDLRNISRRRREEVAFPLLISLAGARHVPPKRLGDCLKLLETNVLLKFAAYEFVSKRCGAETTAPPNLSLKCSLE